MTTTPPEPGTEPEIVPSGDPSGPGPIDPGTPHQPGPARPASLTGEVFGTIGVRTGLSDHVATACSTIDEEAGRR